MFACFILIIHASHIKLGCWRTLSLSLSCLNDRRGPNRRSPPPHISTSSSRAPTRFPKFSSSVSVKLTAQAVHSFAHFRRCRGPCRTVSVSIVKLALNVLRIATNNTCFWKRYRLIGARKGYTWNTNPCESGSRQFDRRKCACCFMYLSSLARKSISLSAMTLILAHNTRPAASEDTPP